MLVLKVRIDVTFQNNFVKTKEIFKFNKLVLKINNPLVQLRNFIRIFITWFAKLRKLLKYHKLLLRLRTTENVIKFKRYFALKFQNIFYSVECDFQWSGRVVTSQESELSPSDHS